MENPQFMVGDRHGKSKTKMDDLPSGYLLLAPGLAAWV
jgi:hypothetical protein